MSFRVRAEAVRRHAEVLEAEARVWAGTVERRLDCEDTELSRDACSAAGEGVREAYAEVRTGYGELLLATGRALDEAADLLRHAADAYDDADAAAGTDIAKLL